MVCQYCQKSIKKNFGSLEPLGGGEPIFFHKKCHDGFIKELSRI